MTVQEVHQVDNYFQWTQSEILQNCSALVMAERGDCGGFKQREVAAG